MMNVVVAAALLLAHASSVPVSPQAVSITTKEQHLLDEASTVKINIRIGDRVVPATLNGSKAAQDFASLLPLSLTLDDYASTEKISDLPKKLSTDGAPPGFDPSVGDIAYYAPWGNLAIFYRDFRYSRGLVSLGTLASGTDLFASGRSMQVTIELAPR